MVIMPWFKLDVFHTRPQEILSFFPLEPVMRINLFTPLGRGGHYEQFKEVFRAAGQVGGEEQEAKGCNLQNESK